VPGQAHLRAPPQPEPYDPFHPGVEKLATGALAEIGQTGLKFTSGFLTEEFLPDLRGPLGRRAFSEMANNDPTCGAVLFAITNLIRRASWNVKPADDSNAAGEAKDFVHDALFKDMSHTWDDFMSEALTMLSYGFAPHEIVWKIRRGPDEAPEYRSRFTDGKFAPRKLPLRSQDTVARWLFDPSGGIQGFEQGVTGSSGAAMVNRVTIPIERMLLNRTTPVLGNPEGKSIFRNSYRPWWFKKRIEEFEAIGVERDLAGFPVLRVPKRLLQADAQPPDKMLLAEYTKLVSEIRRDAREGLVLSSERDDKGNFVYEFTLVTSGGQRQHDTSAIISRYDNRVAIVTLTDFIFLGASGRTGSFALSTDKTELFTFACEAFIGSIADVINRHLIPRWWKLNGEPEDTMPTLEPGKVTRISLQELADYIKSLSGAGAPMFPDEELENNLRERADLPPVPEDRELPDPTIPVVDPTLPQPDPNAPPPQLPPPKPKQAGALPDLHLTVNIDGRQSAKRIGSMKRNDDGSIRVEMTEEE
jgi:hypothetical protein